MKEIKAYIRNNMVDRVVAALGEVGGVSGIAVVGLKAYGHAASDGNLTMVEMTKIEIVVADRWADTVVECVVENGRTESGHPGDGRVFVSAIAEAIRIEDGARGEATL